jgi:type VI secretion system protein ImpL
VRVLGRILWVLFMIAGTGALCAAIWVGLPILGNDTLADEDVRLGLIGGVVLLLLLVTLLRRSARRRAARQLEDSLYDSHAGDGEILAERMQDAVAKLKNTGGYTALYDLPWYVLIGPPGAGKTTALVHSGLEFPGTDPAAVAGFGGTRNCDFWFARDAVLVDTAGRYTTQDSDAQADRASWAAFLTQLKSARPDQPINGVILALSCADLMTAGDRALSDHADTIRARLIEVQEALRTHVPVYVVFTKADMVAGFRQFFGTFDEARRRGVWGVTFQTRSRKEDTWRMASREYAHLITRLSDEVTDRLVEELDSATRIAIFEFPSQMAMLEPKISAFLHNVFEGAAQTRAILRGFYFTSGTQEGTPIDQVLGSIATGGAGGIQPSFMSGRGRSYFLHDLLKKVIFAERDWVGFDRSRVLRRTILRSFGKTVIAAACLAAFGAFGYSFWMNASLVRDAQAQTQVYRDRAARLLAAPYIENAATRPLLPALAAARVIPTGYANPRPQSAFEQFGLSRRETLRGAAIEAYSESLERLLRPRMMLLAERQLAQAILQGNDAAAYRALKVYILLAKEQDGPDDDLAIQSFFAEAWSKEYALAASDEDYRAINAHLSAMLALDDRVTPPVKPNKALVDRARADLADLPLAEQVFSAIRTEAAVLPPWRLADHLAEPAHLRLSDGRLPETLQMPGLFTYEGYWSAFQQALASAQVYVEADAWVLAQGAVNAEARARLVQDVHDLYVGAFAEEWRILLDRISGTSDPRVVVQLAELIDAQTRLVRMMEPDPATGQDNNALKNIKNFWPSVSNGDLRRRSEAVQRGFVLWHGLVAGPAGTRPVDQLARDLVALQADPELWDAVAGRAEGLPPVLGRIAGQAGLAGAEAALVRNVGAVCRSRIGPYYPFAGSGSAPLPLSDFAAFFGYGGHMDQFWRRYAGQGGIVLPVSDVVRGDFAQVEEMRARFFAPGSAVPEVPLALRLGGVTSGVVSVDVDLGDGNQRLVTGGPGVAVIWPSEVTRMLWTVNVGEVDAVTTEAEGGPWSVLSLLRMGEDVRIADGSITLTRRAGPHAFRVIIEAGDAGTPPFSEPFWGQFTCPAGLD